MRNFLVGLALGAAMVLVGSMDFQDALIDQQYYCDMVRSGAWSDYRDNYTEVCPTLEPSEERSTQVPSDPVSTLPEASDSGRIMPREVRGFYVVPRPGVERYRF